MDYRYLGREHDEILRRQESHRVERYKRDRLGWQTALAAAQKFSDGKVCCKGEGSGRVGEREREVEGEFNICYWVQVKGIKGEWVVRFPKFGILDNEITLLRMRSEIATINFLHDHTKVPVPQVIGFDEGDDGFPPFIILKGLNGIRMTQVLSMEVDLSNLDRVLTDLATIQLELLLHPFNRIGMLDFRQQSSHDTMPDVVQPTLGPYSLDSMNLARDGVLLNVPEPFESARTYYNYKVGLWREMLNDQRNSVDSAADGRRKLLNEHILLDHMDMFCPPDDEDGPFYLAHPDLHASNVILDPNSFAVVGIVDWEGACILPIASSCTPPKCLFIGQKDCLTPNSKVYLEFADRVERYVGILSKLEQNTTESLQRRHVPFPSYRMSSCLTTKTLFFSWALDDVRYVDQLIWQHIVPVLYPQFLDTLYKAIDITKPEGTEAVDDAIHRVLDAFVCEQLFHSSFDKQQWSSWWKAKLEELQGYDRELEGDQ